MKSYYYYDKSLLYMKQKIAIFENSEMDMQNAIEILADSLQNQSVDYFEHLISKINFKILPKSFKIIGEQLDTVKNIAKTDCNIEKINYYIDGPIELYIIDLLWMLFIGKIATENEELTENTYAGKLKKSLYNKYCSDLFNGIDFNSNRCFEPYFNQYSNWRDNAFKAIEANQINSDLVMVNLDLQNFYYSVEFDFSNLKKLLAYDARLDKIEFLTEIQKQVFEKYTKIIRELKPGVTKEDNKCIFPIGLLSPVILRELYLKKLDNTLLKRLTPYYYGRYVDDMLFVINVKGNPKDTDGYIQELFIENNILLQLKNDTFRFVDFPNLKLQAQKMNFIYFPRSKSNILLDIYKKKIKINASTVNLLPDIDLLNNSFNDEAYKLGDFEKSHKVQDFHFLDSDNYHAVRFIKGLTKLIQNTNATKNTFSNELSQVLDFYTQNHCLLYFNSWRSIFELFILCGDKDRIKIFHKSVTAYINKLTLELLSDKEMYIKKKKTKRMLCQIKNNLLEYLDISYSLAGSLNINYVQKTNKRRQYALLFRKANMLNHNLTTLPLINYSSMVDDINLSLTNADISKYVKISDVKLALDKNKLKWSPRYIHLNELYLYYSLFKIGKGGKRFQNNPNYIYDSYKEINSLNWSLNNPIIYSEVKYPDLNVFINKFEVQNLPKNKVKIGLVNTELYVKDCMGCLDDPTLFMTFENKKRLFRILNNAIAEKVEMIVFPEFYLPIYWLNDIANFSKNYNVSIVTGLNYIKSGNIVNNFVAQIKSTESSSGFRHSIVLLREKNHYAPAERDYISKKGLHCFDNSNPIYHIISDKNMVFSTILCFEFTDISVRAALRSQIDTLVVPQFNRDTNYFASIVESAARDLHCFVIQANTSIFGDSRITAPYKTYDKNIVQIKGGQNDTLLVADIDVQELRRFQYSYEQTFQRNCSICFNCKKTKNKSYVQIEKICRKCKSIENQDRKIKNLPPNYNKLD